MAICIRCSSTLPIGESSCPQCGRAEPETADGVPRGTWQSEISEQPTDLAAVLSMHPSSTRSSFPPGHERLARAPERGPAPVAAAAAVAHRTEEVSFADALRDESTGRVLRLAGNPEHSDVVERSKETKPIPCAAKAARPPVLASESLREDLEPTEPGRVALRIVGTTCALVGAATLLLLGNLEAVQLVLAAAFGVIALLCIAPIGYAPRACGVLGVGTLGLALDTGARMLAGGPAEAPVLAAGIAVLSGGLLFRARYRASRVARLAIALGIAVVGAWFLLAGGLTSGPEIDGSVRGWLPFVMRVGLLPLLLLSLLAFMDASSTGGARVWAVLLVLWYAGNVGVHLGLGLADHPEIFALETLRASATAITVAAPLFLALAAMALAQVLAVIAGGTAERRRRERAQGDGNAT